MAPVVLDFPEIADRLRAITLPEIDRVVGVATGGVVPASLIAYRLQRPLDLIRIRYRDEDNQPLFPAPRVMAPGIDLIRRERILLVDDVSVSGKTLEVACQTLAGHQVFTLVMKGKADYVVFPEIAECVNWPWKKAEIKNPG